MATLAVILVPIAVAVLAVYFGPAARKAGRFEAELAVRDPVSDEELFRRFFTAADEFAHVPGPVRRSFAKHMEYPAEKMLPDDDLDFFWYDLDIVDVIRDLEAEFGIKFSAKDPAWTTLNKCTIRALTLYVIEKLLPTNR